MTASNPALVPKGWALCMGLGQNVCASQSEHSPAAPISPQTCKPSAIRIVLQVCHDAPHWYMPCQNMNQQAKGCVQEHSGDYSESERPVKERTLLLVFLYLTMEWLGEYAHTSTYFGHLYFFFLFKCKHKLSESPCSVSLSLLLPP